MTTPKKALKSHLENIEKLIAQLQTTVEEYKQYAEQKQAKDPTSWAGVGRGTELQSIENELSDLIRTYGAIE